MTQSTARRIVAGILAVLLLWSASNGPLASNWLAWTITVSQLLFGVVLALVAVGIKLPDINVPLN